MLLAAVLVFFVVFFNAFQGVREVDQNLVANVARARRLAAAGRPARDHPSAMTWIIASLHTAFGFAIVGALVAEVLGAQHGIGLIISQAQGQLRPEHRLRLHGDHRPSSPSAPNSSSPCSSTALLDWRPPSRSEAQAI